MILLVLFTDITTFLAKNRKESQIVQIFLNKYAVFANKSPTSIKQSPTFTNFSQLFSIISTYSKPTNTYTPIFKLKTSMKNLDFYAIAYKIAISNIIQTNILRICEYLHDRF